MENEKLGMLIMSLIEYLDDKTLSVVNAELKLRGASDQNVDQFENQIQELENDLSELSGSPDRGVAQRFLDHCEQFDKLLISIVGQSDFDEMDHF